MIGKNERYVSGLHDGLSRRRFLRGLGACVALPTFSSFAPKLLAADAPGAAGLATTATGAPLRAAFIFFPNGAIPGTWWPKGEGSDFALSRTLQPEANPRLAFERLFGAGAPGERRANLQKRREEQRSVLDFVLDDARSFQRRLDRPDRGKLDQYLTGVREVEMRIQKAEKLGDG